MRISLKQPARQAISLLAAVLQIAYFAILSLTLSLNAETATADTSAQKRNSPLLQWFGEHYSVTALGVMETPTARNQKSVFGGERQSAVLVGSRKSAGQPKWVIIGPEGCAFGLSPTQGSTPFGTVNEAQLLRNSSCNPDDAGPRLREVDRAAISALTDQRRIQVLLSSKGELVAYGLLFTPEYAGNPDRKDKDRKVKSPASLSSVNGLYVVMSSGIAQIKVKRRSETSEQWDMFMIKGSDAARGMDGKRFAYGSWVPSSQRLIATEYPRGGCPFPTFTHPVVPVVGGDGRLVPGLFQETKNPPDLPANERSCMVGKYTNPGCKLVKCFKWSDHPDFANSPPTYLTASRSQAERLYAGMAKWTHERHGKGLASKHSKPRSGGEHRDYAAEASKRAVEDYLIDLWNTPAN